MTDLEELKAKAEEALALANKATDGPWENSIYFSEDLNIPNIDIIPGEDLAISSGPCVSREQACEYAIFISRSRTLAPLLAEGVLELIKRLKITEEICFMNQNAALSITEKLAVAEEALEKSAERVLKKIRGEK